MNETERKCPFCKGEMDERTSKKLRKAIRIIIVTIIAVVVSLSLYSYLDSLRIDNSHDVLFHLPNTLTYSIHQDALGASGGIVAVYGNISNPGLSEQWVYSMVVIDVYDGYNRTQFYIGDGVLDGGESRYFSWAYHFDQLNVSSCDVNIEVIGS